MSCQVFQITIKADSNSDGPKSEYELYRTNRKWVILTLDTNVVVIKIVAEKSQTT